MEAVKSVNLAKIYNGKVRVEALKGVNLTINEGELFALLGPNGAGKTTFLRIISTQLLPTSGEAYVLGFNVLEQAEKVREHIAVVPQDAATYGNFTPWDYCYYFSLLRGMTKQKAKEMSEKALKSVELWNFKDRMCATLSGGEEKRTIIAAALASDAEVLMLDEPTSGLDAVARRKVWAVLREMVEQGKTILLTTHIMEEAEMVSDRLAIINNGNLIAQGTIEEIKNLVKEKFRVMVEGKLQSLEKFVSNYASVSFGSKRVFYVYDGDEAIELVGNALRSGLKAEASPITLEDVFVKLIGGEANES